TTLFRSVARAAGKDSLEFRRELMANHPKHLGVLNAATEKGGWGKPLPAGVHRGIAQFMGYASYSAAVAEVSVSAEGKLKIHRMVLALNCGHAVNPDQIAAQVEGSVAYGLTATLYGECSVENGRMVESNFHNYPIMRLAEMPKVETVIVPTYDFWGGVGALLFLGSELYGVFTLRPFVGRNYDEAWFEQIATVDALSTLGLFVCAVGLVGLSWSRRAG